MHGFETSLFAWLQPLIETYGLSVMFVVLTLESIGIPLPGESALVLSAFYAAATGNINIVTVVLVATAAASLGDNIGYWIGRKYGPSFIERHGPKVGLTPARAALGNRLFADHGGKIVFFGRFFAFLRTFAAVLAGASGMHWTTFLITNMSGALLWASTFGFGAYFFGDHLKALSGPLQFIAFLLTVGVLVAIGYYLKHLERHLMRDRSEG